MKALKLLAIAAISVFTACGTKANDSAAAENAETADAPKVLVAYFSATGNTKAVAEIIAETTGATLYEITPEPRYTDADLDWRDKTSRSTIEMNDPACRPELGGDAIDVADFDIVFIGYPIWWDLAPRQVNTFIETYDLGNKRLIPFATSGSSPITGSEQDLHRLYPELNWAEGKLLNAPAEVADWAASQLK